jgi:dihydrofolate reductase
MSVVVATMAVSLDGFGSGNHQTRERPFGEAPEDALHRWMFDEPDKHQAEIDAICAAGAFIMGRNMFGPVRGEWTEQWSGWWGAYLAAGLVDELRLHFTPVVLGTGVRLFEGVPRIDLEPIEIRPTPLVTHAHYRVLHPERHTK